MEDSPTDPLLAFGSRLRRLRLDRQLSHEQLGALAHLDRTYVSSCEAGRRNVTLRTICRLSSALDVDPSALVTALCPTEMDGSE
jgi:transcriptional regulator with XRE-family HTH domain